MNDSLANLPLFTAIALCQSALLSLYDCHCCVENAEASEMGRVDLLEMQKIAIAGMRDVSGEVIDFAKRIKGVAELGGMLRMTPLVCDCLYQAATALLWYVNETACEIDLNQAIGIKHVLEILGNRWKLASRFSGR